MGWKKQPTSPRRSELYKNVLFGKLLEHNSFAWAIGRNLGVQKSNASLCWCVETCVSIWVSLCNSCNGSHRAWIHLLRVPFSALNKRGDTCAIVETPNKWTCEREVLVSMYAFFYLGSMTIPNYNQTGIKTTEMEGVCFKFQTGRRSKVQMTWQVVAPQFCNSLSACGCDIRLYPCPSYPFDFNPTLWGIVVSDV